MIWSAIITAFMTLVAQTAMAGIVWNVVGVRCHDGFALSTSQILSKAAVARAIAGSQGFWPLRRWNEAPLLHILDDEDVRSLRRAHPDVAKSFLPEDSMFMVDGKIVLVRFVPAEPVPGPEGTAPKEFLFTIVPDATLRMLIGLRILSALELQFHEVKSRLSPILSLDDRTISFFAEDVWWDQNVQNNSVNAYRRFNFRGEEGAVKLEIHGRSKVFNFSAIGPRGLRELALESLRTSGGRFDLRKSSSPDAEVIFMYDADTFRAFLRDFVARIDI